MVPADVICMIVFLYVCVFPQGLCVVCSVCGACGERMCRLCMYICVMHTCTCCVHGCGLCVTSVRVFVCVYVYMGEVYVCVSEHLSSSDGGAPPCVSCITMAAMEVGALLQHSTGVSTVLCFCDTNKLRNLNNNNPARSHGMS